MLNKMFKPYFMAKQKKEAISFVAVIIFMFIENIKVRLTLLQNVNQGIEFIITLPVNTQ
jgi:two-component system NtrC family sensor kinase